MPGIPLRCAGIPGCVLPLSLIHIYTHLAACRKLPTTSQPSPERFERLYLDAAAAGDEVLGIFLSDALSGTCLLYTSRCV